MIQKHLSDPRGSGAIEQTTFPVMLGDDLRLGNRSFPGEVGEG